MVSDLATVTEMGNTWVKAISITACISPVDLFYLCCSLTLLAFFVCAVSLSLDSGLFLWLFMGRASSLLDNHSIPKGCIMLYLTMPFLTGVSMVSISWRCLQKKLCGFLCPWEPTFLVRKWEEYAFFSWYTLKVVRVHAYFWVPERDLHVITKKWYRFRKHGLLLCHRHLLALDKSF